MLTRPREQPHFLPFCSFFLLSLFSLSPPQKEKVQSRAPPPPQSQQNPLKRPTSLTDLSHAHEEQEVEFLKLQVAEQRGLIDELTQVSLTRPVVLERVCVLMMSLSEDVQRRCWVARLDRLSALELPLIPCNLSLALLSGLFLLSSLFFRLSSPLLSFSICHPSLFLYLSHLSRPHHTLSHSSMVAIS